MLESPIPPKVNTGASEAARTLAAGKGGAVDKAAEPKKSAGEEENNDPRMGGRETGRLVPESGGGMLVGAAEGEKVKVGLERGNSGSSLLRVTPPNRKARWSSWASSAAR